NTLIANFEHSGRGFPLICVDNQTGKPKWEVDAWAFGAEVLRGWTGPRPWHDLTLVTKENRLAVFGRGSAGCYVEIYDMEQGRNLVRFATNFWYAKWMVSPLAAAAMLV